MKKTLQILFLLTNIQLLNAQKLTNTYGKIGQAEILYESCEFDKTAEAVVMFDKGESIFRNDDDGSFKIIYERITRIKILTDAGIKWGEIAIPYYYSGGILEDISDIEATTYNLENGQINKTTLYPKDCHDEKLNENWTLKKFAIPNIKKGSIIEYRYKIESPYLFNLRSWEFQWRIPVLTSQYSVRMIPFYQYTFILQGASTFDEHTSEEDTYDKQYGSIKYHDLIHSYKVGNIPAFKDEEFITSKDDYIIKVNFQLSKVNYPNGSTVDIMTTWPKLIDELLKDDKFGKYIVKTKKMTPKILNPDGLTRMTSTQKFDSVMNYVKHNFMWDKRERKYATKKPTDLMKDKFGSSSDLNLFAIGLLNGIGIEAYPLLVSTREHGKIKLNYPFNDFFDYSLITVKIDSTYILADATDIMLANNRIPISCINDKGLIIKKEGKIQWLNLQTKLPSKRKTNLIIDLNDTENNASISLSGTEYDALKLRKIFGTNLKEIQNKLIQKGYVISDSNIIIKNQNNYSAPYYLNLKFSHNPEKIDDKIYVSPFLNEVINNNPLKQKERSNPIDMVYPELRHFTSIIKIPKGFKIDYLPKNSKIKNELFELEYNSTVSENIITVSFSYFFKQSEYPASEYSNLKYYFNEIINKSSEKVVLKKA